MTSPCWVSKVHQPSASHAFPRHSSASRPGGEHPVEDLLCSSPSAKSHPQNCKALASQAQPSVVSIGKSFGNYSAPAYDPQEKDNVEEKKRYAKAKAMVSGVWNTRPHLRRTVGTQSTAKCRFPTLKLLVFQLNSRVSSLRRQQLSGLAPLHIQYDGIFNKPKRKTGRGDTGRLD